MVDSKQQSYWARNIDLLDLDIPTARTAQVLDDWAFLPPYLAINHKNGEPHPLFASCSYCGIGDSFYREEISGNFKRTKPSNGCVKLEYSRMNKASAYDIHLAPSVKAGNGMRAVSSYRGAISKFADLVMEYLENDSQILIYACGQVDYFAIFAMQEVFRLLGIRNLTGNAEHCLNSGAVHNEILTGQEGPFVSIEQALEGNNRLYILNGWNGCITHPPVFKKLMTKSNLDAVLFDVVHTESAHALESKLSEDVVAPIKACSDPHIAFAVAHYIFTLFPEKIDTDFICKWSDTNSFEAFRSQAMASKYSVKEVARRVAAEPRFEERIVRVIKYIANRLLMPDTVPVVIPSVGLSQSTGVVAHCLWACVIAMLGKFGLDVKSNLLGGILRLPGQINAESEVQGLSRKYFMGRIPMTNAADAAARMGLPEDAYDHVLRDNPIPALDYSKKSEKKQLFIFFGTQFEANMPNRTPWINKLSDKRNAVIVVDPIPDPWSIINAELIIPSPPHSAAPKLYQNGEWRLTLSVPSKIAANETRSDATIIYDLMEEICKRLMSSPALRNRHPNLSSHLNSGYLQKRFCSPKIENGVPGLERVDGEVSRVQLFDRIHEYMAGGQAPLFCSFVDESGERIKWQTLLTKGSIIYGGVGTTRFMLDYSKERSPFSDIYQRPRKFHFFTPQEDDLVMPEGVVLNSGRSALSENRQRFQFAVKSFNSGKATPVDDIPIINPAYVSRLLASSLALKSGDWVRIKSLSGSEHITLPIVVSDRVYGSSVYISFHRSKYQESEGVYINSVTNNDARCKYSSQVKLKSNLVSISKAYGIDFKVSKYLNNTTSYSLWDGEERSFAVCGILREADGCTTFQLLPDPPCRIDFKPGQYCLVNLMINGKRQSRAYSISSSPSNPYSLEITVKRVEYGLVSNWLIDNVIVGDSLYLSRIRGEFCLHSKDTPKLLFIGAGSGLTPLMSMIRWLGDVNPTADIDFYISAKSAKTVLFARDLVFHEKLMPNLKLWVVPTGDDLHSPIVISGRIDSEKLAAVSRDHAERQVYICGPDSFIRDVRQILQELHQPSESIHFESFGLRSDSTPTHQGEPITVSYLPQVQEIKTDGTETLLEIAENNAIAIDSACRSGSCGACLVKVEGETVSRESCYLDEDSMAEGYRLACITFPKANCSVSSA